MKKSILLTIILLTQGCASTGTYWNEFDDRFMYALKCGIAGPTQNVPERFIPKEEYKKEYKKGIATMGPRYQHYLETGECVGGRIHYEYAGPSYVGSPTEEEKLEMDCVLVTGNRYCITD